jgi:hypothetical protein
MADVQLSTLGSVIQAAYEAETDTALTRYKSSTTDATASYEFVLANSGGIHTMTSASANGCVIPDSAVTPFPVGARIDFIQRGAGLTTFTITTDTLVGDAVSTGQNKAMSIWQESLGVWVIIGGTTA